MFYSTLLNNLLNYNHINNIPTKLVSNEDDSYNLKMAFPGASKEDLDITIENNKLKISSKKYIFEESERPFKVICINLPKFSEIENPCLKNGILEIPIRIKIPEENKPRKIYIS